MDSAPKEVIDKMFSGSPIPQDEPCGWMERMDALNVRPDKPMPGPWHWEIHDYSMATLCGGGEDAITGHIMAVSPCRSCQKSANGEWKWGRCQTPSEANARLIEKAPELLAMLGQCLAFFTMNGFPQQAEAVGKLIDAATTRPSE